MRLDRLDVWTEPRRFRIEAAGAAAYAAASGDEDPDRLAGRTVAPMYAVVPAREPGVEATHLVVPAEVSARVPGLHGEQDMRFHVPLRPGMELLVRAAARGVAVKRSGTLVIVCVELTEQDGAPVGEHWITSFFPGLTSGESAGVPAAEHGPAPWRERAPERVVVQPTAADQPRRYAAAAQDPTEFHLDEAVARAYGLPGVILHGLCTMAFCANAVAGGLPLRRLAVRFRKPVFPGESLRTSIWETGTPGELAFETATTDDDALVIEHGRAELAL